MKAWCRELVCTRSTHRYLFKPGWNCINQWYFPAWVQVVIPTKQKPHPSLRKAKINCLNRWNQELWNEPAPRLDQIGLDTSDTTQVPCSVVIQMTSDLKILMIVSANALLYLLFALLTLQDTCVLKSKCSFPCSLACSSRWSHLRGALTSQSSQCHRNHSATQDTRKMRKSSKQVVYF